MLQQYVLRNFRTACHHVVSSLFSHFTTNPVVLLIHYELELHEDELQILRKIANSSTSKLGVTVPPDLEISLVTSWTVDSFLLGG